jgi:type II secretory pathway predicted ATPase ExeA
MTGNSFGLQEEAFRLTPDPRFLFPTRSVVQALSGMLTGIAQRKGLLQLTSESGTGKTAVMQKLAHDLEASSSFVFVWTHPHLPFDDLIMACAEKAGLRLRAGGRDDHVRSLTDKVTQMLSGAATAVILIDEAEKCSDEVLEGLLELARIDRGMSWAWQIVLAAPLSFETRLQDDRWQSLHQEIGVRVALERLRGPEVRAYIAHRLHVAGLTRGALFTPEALSRIETYAAGIPRLVNRLCSRALAEAASIGAWSVTADMVDVAAREFSIGQSSAEGVVLPDPAPSMPAAPSESAPPPPTPASEAPPAPPKTAETGSALLGSMFRQFAEESQYRTELSATSAANESARETARTEKPAVAEAPPEAEPPAPTEAPPQPIEAAAPLDLKTPADAPPARESEPVAPPAAETEIRTAEAQVAADPPPQSAEAPPEPVAAAREEPANEIPPHAVPAEQPAKADEPAPEAAAAEAAAAEAPKDPEAAPAEAAAPPDPEKLALKAKIAATIAASEAKTTLHAPTEEDRLLPANDHEPAERGKLAGQMVKIAAAVVIGLAVGALGAYVIQLRPTGSDQIAAVRNTTQDTAPRPQAMIESPLLPPANTATAPTPEPTPATPPAPAPTLNRITPSAGPTVVPPAPPPPPAAAAIPEPPPVAKSNGVAAVEKPAEIKPEAPSAAPAAPVVAIPPPPPPKPPMETPPPAPPVVSAPPPPVVRTPPPAPPAVAEIPPPPPPRPMAQAAPVPLAPPPVPQASIPAPPPVPAPPPPPAPQASIPAAPPVASAPPPVARTPTPAPQIAAVEPAPTAEMGPPIDAIPESRTPPRSAEPPSSGRALLPILPPASPAPGSSSADATPAAGRILAPILPPSPPPAADLPAPAPSPSARTLAPILPTPVAPPPVATPAPPVEPVTPKIAEAPLPPPTPEPPAPQMARVEPTPLAPPPVEKPVVETPAPARPPAVARVEPPPASPAPPAVGAPVPLQRPSASLSSAAVDRLMLRGDEIMRTGDPAAARLFYELAAANGSATAATAVGRTWDPVEHARLGIQGSLSSSQRAADWYRKASAAGDAEAETRLRALTAWMARNPGR